ncbi:MAG: (2Fe-2S) ferredoxin domain-containing protein [Brevinematales bacterium]|nr:(2Fe-2S) ferredoxin domain-containing protein [Brevinematales bacterium]
MPKLTLEELRKLRENTKKEIAKRDVSDKSILVLVGMGTCGIAAGARETLQAFLEQIEKKGLTNVVIKPTGCMGFCYVEPTVEIIMPDMPDTLYGKVRAEVVEKIVDEHIIRKQLVSEFIFDKPAVDIVK